MKITSHSTQNNALSSAIGPRSGISRGEIGTVSILCPPFSNVLWRRSPSCRLPLHGHLRRRVARAAKTSA
jgi:hypothetical protein